MKRLFQIICLLLTCCSTTDTDDKKFDDTFHDYVSAFNENKYDEFLKFIPSQTFEKVSKKQVLPPTWVFMTAADFEAAYCPTCRNEI